MSYIIEKLECLVQWVLRDQAIGRGTFGKARSLSQPFSVPQEEEIKKKKRIVIRSHSDRLVSIPWVTVGVGFKTSRIRRGQA